MKLLIRVFCLVVFFLICVLCVLNLNNTNYIINEMHNAAYLSIEETMLKEMDYLSGKRNTIDLKEELTSSFNNLVTNNKLYLLNIETNEDLGILKLEVSTNNKFVRNIKLVNIIENLVEVNQRGGKDDFNVDDFIFASRSDNVLYHKEFETPILLKSFYIDIEAYTKSNNYSVYNRCEPEMKITIIDDEDNVITYKKPAIYGTNTLKEVNFDSDNYDFEELYVKSVKLEMKGVSRSMVPKADLLRIGSTNKNYFEYEGENTQIHTIYSRYVDENYVPPINSLWNNKEYQDTLINYLYEKTN